MVIIIFWHLVVFLTVIIKDSCSFNCICKCYCIFTHIINYSLFFIEGDSCNHTNFCMEINFISKIHFVEFLTTCTKKVISVQIGVTLHKRSYSAWVFGFNLSFNSNIFCDINKGLWKVIIIFVFDDCHPFIIISPECMTNFMQGHQIINITIHIF